MTTDVDLVSDLLHSSFQVIGIEPVDWYNATVYDGANEDQHQISSYLRSQFGKMKRGLMWNRYIPPGQICRFLATALGYDLLRYAPVRSLLFQAFLARRNTPSHNSLRNGVCNSFQSPLTITDKDLIILVENLDWRPSTMRAFCICKAIGLPSRFAIVGNHEHLDAVVSSAPVRRLHDLLDFQIEVKNGLVKKLDTNQRCIVCMPTGAGKTRTTVESILEFFGKKNQKIGGVLWIADRQELCEQAVQTFLHLTQFLAPQTPIYRMWGGLEPEIEFTLQDGTQGFAGIAVTSTQQFRSRLQKGNLSSILVRDLCEVVVIDEAHRNLEWCEHFINKLAEMENPPSVVGLTATPLRRVRNETTTLARIFGEQTITPLPESQDGFSDAISYLQHINVLARRIDVSLDEIGVELQTEYNNPLSLTDAYRVATEFTEHQNLSSVLVFAESVEQSKSLAMMLNMAGHGAKHLDGTTPVNQRRKIIDEFRDGEIRFLVNFDILTTGFDAPRTDGVVILRATEDVNQPLITQMIGRGLRGSLFGGTDSCSFFIRGAES